MQYIQQLYEKYEYEEVGSPNIYNFELWNTSGHAAHYKENMFVFQVEKQEFGLKPMNCPGPVLLCWKPPSCIIGRMRCGCWRSERALGVSSIFKKVDTICLIISYQGG